MGDQKGETSAPARSIDMNKFFAILLTSAMVLSIVSCGNKESSNAVNDVMAEKEAAASKQPAAQEQTDSQEQNTAQMQVISKESNEDPVSTLFNGLWITNSSIGTLYYFDSGEVTCYTSDNYDPSMPDLHYKLEKKEHYETGEVTSQDGSGYKAILESGNEYWLLDDYPDVLSCYWYDENGDLQLSGSSSLMRVTDYTVDDLIVE